MQNHKTYIVDEAKRKLEHYCAYQERCHKEVTDKLKLMGMIPEAIAIIIGHLIEENYLNEERFSKAFVRGKLRIKYWGKRRLIIELRKKDISTVNINIALSEISDNEYMSVFELVLEKGLKSIKETHVFKRKKKLVDYLLYRGWESSLVYDRVNDVVK